MRFPRIAVTCRWSSFARYNFPGLSCHDRRGSLPSPPLLLSTLDETTTTTTGGTASIEELCLLHLIVVRPFHQDTMEHVCTSTPRESNKNNACPDDASSHDDTLSTIATRKQPLRRRGRAQPELMMALVAFAKTPRTPRGWQHPRVDKPKSAHPVVAPDLPPVSPLAPCSHLMTSGEREFEWNISL